MRYFLLTITFLLLNWVNASADSQLPREVADAFIDQILADTATVEHFLAAEELWNSRRLGIEYEGVRDKFLIQFEIEPAIARAVRRGRFEYTTSLDSLDQGFTRLTFSVPEREYTQKFYFRKGRLVSPASYYTREWKQVRSKYFHFIISDPNDFNEVAARQLDAFVDSMSVTLNIDSTRLARLRDQKIIYLLCHDTEEIEAISGFAVRGTYILAYDQIISTFNCHFHEVAHLLINYKLQNLRLYTHPFFQEGFACAVGGRGGKSPRVINNLGEFLQESEFLTYPEILNAYDFRENDPSLAYPLSGVYNRFLIEKLGIEEYLDIYLKHSSTYPKSSDRLLDEVVLPPDEDFFEFLAGMDHEENVTFPPYDSLRKPIVEKHWGRIWDYGDSYYFQVRGSLRMIPETPLEDFISMEFREIFPDVRYAGERYFLEVSAEEVKLFDFYTSTLIAFYSAGLTLDRKKVWHDDGYYAFALRKSLFAEELHTLLFAQ